MHQPVVVDINAELEKKRDKRRSGKKSGGKQTQLEKYREYIEEEETHNVLKPYVVRRKGPGGKSFDVVNWGPVLDEIEVLLKDNQPGRRDGRSMSRYYKVCIIILFIYIT